jgi:hypothetical protein
MMRLKLLGPCFPLLLLLLLLVVVLLRLLLLLVIVLIRFSFFLLSQCTQLPGKLLLLPHGCLQQTRKDLPACCYCIPLLLGQLENLNSSKELLWGRITTPLLLLMLTLLLLPTTFVSANWVVDPSWVGQCCRCDDSSVV